MVKNPSIDLLRGLLILLVMAGHAMELAHQNHVMLWIGGGFRMPMMFGLSGFLLNIDRTRNEGAASLFGRYANRMLLPWAVAVCVYILASGWSLSLSTPLELLLRPPFHLWYVPVLFFLIVMTRLVPFSPLALLAIGAPISLATMYSFGLDHGPMGFSLLSPDNRYLRYPVYFFFGMLVAERGLPTRYLAVALLAGALGLFWWVGLYGTGNALAFVPARLLMCLSLIALLPHLSARHLFFAPLGTIGHHSLLFYLWHPLVMGMLLIAGMDGLALLLLSIVILAFVALFVTRYPLARQLIGGAPPCRARPAAVKPPPVAAAA
ncbi:acyltransferase family protein [Sphingobium sp.]|uniref:acyltransferase family protein n=1 Tax=Sphingobium sp. TaxID=1912891 RepID=UPI003BB70EE4